MPYGIHTVDLLEGLDVMQWAKITVTTSQEASEAVANFLLELLNATGVELKDSDASTVNLIAYYPLDDRVGGRMQRLRNFPFRTANLGNFVTPRQNRLTTRQIRGLGRSVESRFSTAAHRKTHSHHTHVEQRASQRNRRCNSTRSGYGIRDRTTPYHATLT